MSGTAARAATDLPSAEVEVIREIGKGSFGTVMLCRRSVGDDGDVEYIVRRPLRGDVPRARANRPAS